MTQGISKSAVHDHLPKSFLAFGAVSSFSFFDEILTIDVPQGSFLFFHMKPIFCSRE